MISSARRRRTLLGATVGACLAGLVLAGCGGGDDDPEALDLSTVTAAASTPTTAASPVKSGWSVGAKKDKAWTAELKDITEQLDGLKTGLDSDDMDVYFKASENETKQEARLIGVTEEMAAATTGTGIGHVACVVAPVQLKLLADSADDPDRAMFLGVKWVTPVTKAARAGGNTADQVSFADVQLDAQMLDECPDVRQDVLDFAGVDSVDDLYDAAGVKKS
ncbi:hypothetical protein KIH74_30795 [Kineosporia sp. J2-2]|uniref:Lipoprotein n=1 Tax=Kineosporia corallincola TaxID=2835133 RepID=A0ABS5TRF0_9ACTN|nr:hypothetical protein [Kineosporia corallincola]MBT0773374.1 hypothetical protein [Kineosporia corallincola]